jgi:hypothetical protein
MSQLPNVLLRSRVPLLAALLAAAGPAAAGAGHDHDGDDQAHGHREHDPHVHGVAELNVVVDADSLLVELNTPAANLVGFEHPPQTDAQRNAVAEARRTLEDGAALFVPSASAECVQISHLVTLDLGSADDHDHAHDDVHADAHGEWAFTCAKPASLSQLDVKLFERFPGKEQLRVQLVTPSGQRGVELTPGRHRLEL